MEKRRLIKRLKEHYLVEFLNIFLLPLLFSINCFTFNQTIGINTIIAILLSGIVLLEGSYFWFNVLQKVMNKSTYNQNRLKVIFRNLKKINLLLFILAAILITRFPFVSMLDKIGTAIFYTLSILEHINYFEYQLMYDSPNDKKYLKTFKRLKKSKLKRLLLENNTNINSIST